MAADYDLLYPQAHLETAAAVKCLAELASTGVDRGDSILEFGIGTGRLALPLLKQGFHVAGIEGSQAMLARLRAKPRGDELEVVLGDFINTRLDGCFSLVVLAFNGIFDPPTRELQIECFENAAGHLTPGGCLVVESFVLRPQQLIGDWVVWPRSVRHEHVEVQLSRYDATTHLLERTLVHLREDGIRLITVSENYAWPGELDLMARTAGLSLRSRSGSWAGEPFRGSSDKHISIYQRVRGARPS